MIPGTPWHVDDGNLPRLPVGTADAKFSHFAFPPPDAMNPLGTT